MDQLAALRLLGVAALVLADGIVGITEASTTRNPPIPCTFKP
jgi:hypothetical protein